MTPHTLAAQEVMRLFWINSVDILCKERLNLVSGAVICLLRSLENRAKIVCFHWNYTQYYRLVSRTTQKIGGIEVSKP